MIVVIIIVLIALTVWMALKPQGSSLEIYVDGEKKYSYDLEQNRTIDLFDDGNYLIKVENGEVSVTYSDCENQDCVHSAPISREGGTIVCLPKKVVIKVVGEQADVAVVT